MKEKIKLGIIGLGLIGSSILKALSKKPDYEIFVHSNSSYKKAKEYTNNSSCDIEIVKNCDIIFVCTEISKTLEILKNLNSFLDKKTIVADVCSIKKNLSDKTFNFNFILSHPMAGNEKQGFDAGFEELFSGNKWLFDKNKTNKILNKVIKDLGAISTPIDMEKHDELCAQISHFPAVLSALLFDITDEDALKIASSGFRDTTRLALNPDLTFNMYKNNEKNILKSFDKLIENLNNLKKLSDNEKIILFREVAQKRIQMYDKDGKNTL